MRANVVCVNVGPRYPMTYVEVLLDMVLRNASVTEHEVAFWCLTDRPDELPEGVRAIPADPSVPPSYWAKLQLFSADMPWAEGERVVYFDLDVAITGRLEDLLERKGIAPDYGWPTYNSSVMVWDHGEHREAWERFTPDIMNRSPGPLVAADLLPTGAPNAGDQEWLTELGGWDVLPAGWCVSYKWQAKSWPPSEAKVVIFHGAPKPAEITSGWVPNVWKVGGFTSLPVMNGVNVTHDAIWANVRTNVQRDLPWFGQAPVRTTTAVLVAGGPSMADNLSQIRDQRKRGADIVTVNNALGFLVGKGVVPDVHVMLDARPENAAFVANAPEKTTYLIASQCHPDVFEALKDRNVIVWHNGFGDNEALKAILEPWWDGASAKPCILVPGGGTVGLRALWLIALQGYKRIHVYGMDSSYADGAHHAYPQALNDADTIMDVVLSDPETGEAKHYQAARWMARQAEEYKWHRRDLADMGVRLFAHGSGLIPDIDKHLRAQERSAQLQDA